MNKACPEDVFCEFDFFQFLEQFETPVRLDRLGYHDSNAVRMIDEIRPSHSNFNSLRFDSVSYVRMVQLNFPARSGKKERNDDPGRAGSVFMMLILSLTLI